MRILLRKISLLYCYSFLIFFSAITLTIASGQALTSKNSGQLSNISQSVTRSYNADNSVQLGMMVRLKEGDPNIVVPAKSEDFSKLLGVVVPTASASIVITPSKVAKQQVLVASSGRVTVLANNQSGEIKVGDSVALSSIDGVVMAAGNHEENIVGKAVSEFNGSNNIVSKVIVKDEKGKQKNVLVGRVIIDIGVANNPLYRKQSNYVPSLLSSIASTIAGKPVSASRIYLSLAVLLTVIFVSGGLLYSGVNAAIIAIGRNPLSKKSIIRSLTQTTLAGLIVFLTGLVAVYLILKL